MAVMTQEIDHTAHHKLVYPAIESRRTSCVGRM